jgi:hypothetical protein
MLFSSHALQLGRLRPARRPGRPGDPIDVAAQGGDETLAIARQRCILAVHDISLKRRRLDNIERS